MNELRELKLKLKKLKLKKIEKEAQNSFAIFVDTIFCDSFENFVSGDFIRETADFLQNNKWTVRVSAKYHFKSTSLYAFFMWWLFKYRDKNIECHYFSYKEEMAAYHVARQVNKDNIKNLIRRNPWFSGVKDMKPYSETTCDYSWDGKHHITLQPHGLLTAKRGLHCNGIVFVDDPLQDPAEKLDPAIIRRINDVFFSQIIDIPDKNAPLHVVGTPQTREDFFFSDRLKTEIENKPAFAVRIMPAIKKDGQALWPEWLNIEELEMRKQQRGKKIFNQEYLCSPTYTEEGFFQLEDIVRITDKSLKPIDPMKKLVNLERYPIVGGLDIGKKTHPSHISVFKIMGKKWIMIYQRFLDNMDYNEQIELCNLLYENLGLEWLGFDNTRGEFESLMEQDKLNPAMQPVVFSLKNKSSLATELDKKVSNNDIVLLDNSRLKNSLLSVTNDLKAIETSQGHGDAFFSILCAIQWETEGSSGHFIKSSDKSEPITAGIRSQEF